MKQDESAELAALYTVGALPADEQVAFEQQLDAGDPDATAAVAVLTPVVEALAAALPPATPPPTARSKLLERISADTVTTDPEQPVFILHNAEGRWRDTGIPGMHRRQLFIDRERNVQSYLLRCEPGCVAPAHPHPGVEECFVIEGDFHTYGRVLHAGDYMRAPAGSTHTASHTEGGCLLLITTAAADHTDE